MAVAPRNPFKFQYAVKFLCTSNIPGTSQTSASLFPGSYQTAVNIHNPNPKDVRYRMKLASGIGISDFIGDSLKPDGATGVTCDRIRDFGLHLIHGFEGFLVIESTLSLDVVAVYTAGKNANDGVTTMDVEYIRERALR